MCVCKRSLFVTLPKERKKYRKRIKNEKERNKENKQFDSKRNQKETHEFRLFPFKPYSIHVTINKNIDFSDNSWFSFALSPSHHLCCCCWVLFYFFFLSYFVTLPSTFNSFWTTIQLNETNAIESCEENKRLNWNGIVTE